MEVSYHCFKTKQKYFTLVHKTSEYLLLLGKVSLGLLEPVSPQLGFHSIGGYQSRVAQNLNLKPIEIKVPSYPTQTILY